jgi:hypothetical protein
MRSCATSAAKPVRVQDVPGASNSSTEAAISAFDNFLGGTTSA